MTPVIPSSSMMSEMTLVASVMLLNPSIRSSGGRGVRINRMRSGLIFPVSFGSTSPAGASIISTNILSASRISDAGHTDWKWGGNSPAYPVRSCC